MSTDIRVERRRNYSRKNVNADDMVPTGLPFPLGSDGFANPEWIQVTLRVLPTATTSYALEVYTFENDTGNDWIEEPTERRSLAAGVPYTRVFRARTIDGFACRIINLAGPGAKVDVFWTYG